MVEHHGVIYGLFELKVRNSNFLAIFNSFLLLPKEVKKKLESLKARKVGCGNIFCTALGYVIQFDIKANKISHSSL